MFFPKHLTKSRMQLFFDGAFAVRDGLHISDTKPQPSGIAQGCVTSPYLFIIIMTIIMGDVERKVPADFANCGDLAYADDTSIHSDNVDSLQIVFNELVSTAKQYGLEPNLDKTVHSQVRHSDDHVDVYGSPLKAVSNVKYLGSVVTQLMVNALPLLLPAWGRPGRAPPLGAAQGMAGAWQGRGMAGAAVCLPGTCPSQG